MTWSIEARRRWREKYPEKVKQHRITYLDKKIKANPEGIKKVGEKLRLQFNYLTRLLFADVLPKECAVCGTNEYLHIHHIRYIYPIKKEDLMVLCPKHHVEEHQKVNK